MLHTKTIAIGLIFLLAACSGADDAGPASTTGEQSGPPARAAEISAAIQSADRSSDDRSLDSARKPEKVLAFIDVKPGMTIFEMEAGNGYYTELLSTLVGPDGAVVMQSPPAFDSFLGAAIDARTADGRLANVRVSKSSFDNLDAEDNSADVVTWILGPHELWFAPSDGSDLGDPADAFAEVHRILKPGGTFVILDHAAAAGSPEITGGTLHRIDPAIIKTLADEAGFDLIAESDLLRNPDDMFDMGVFDPAVRRNTDRFLLKYRK